MSNVASRAPHSKAVDTGEPSGPLSDRPSVLLLGATGYLGGRLLQRFLAEGWRTVALSRGAGGKGRLTGATYEPAARAADLVRERDFDVIVNAATAYQRGPTQLWDVVEANLHYPLGPLLALCRRPNGLFVNCGTSLPPEVNNYSRAKSEFAEWGRTLATAGGANFIELKLETVFGPGDSAEKFPTLVVRHCLRAQAEPQRDALALSPGTQTRDFIYIDDAVSAIMAVLNQRLGQRLGQQRAQSPPRSPSPFEAIPIGTGVATSLIDFCHLAARHTASANREPVRFDFGARPFRANEVMRSAADLSRLQDLGWSPALTLDQALKKTIEEEIKCAF